jgi:ribosomal protein RSM22 (predicted rRNA methylase)
MLAFAEAFGIEQITCVERSQALVDVGSRVGGTSDNTAVRSARWITGDIGQVRDLPAHHVVVCSYVLGELGNGAVDMLIRAAWLKAGKLLVIIEPGTPDGFRRVHTARSLLLESGGHVVAPCPHQSTCPMFVAGDWCHFPARVERSAEHRRLKGGALGYEDEKFSYIIASKKAAPLPDSRVLRHPLIHPGHLRLALCRPERTESKTVTKSQKALWRYARKLAWGDEWQSPVADPSA